jgi:4,5-DOPA dioxygenase extradiol
MVPSLFIGHGSPPEHFVPIFIALGSGDENKEPVVLNQTYDFGAMSNLCMEF